MDDREADPFDFMGKPVQKITITKEEYDKLKRNTVELYKLKHKYKVK